MFRVAGEGRRRRRAWRQLPGRGWEPFAIPFQACGIVLFWNQLGGGFALLQLLSPELQRLKLMVNKIVRLWPSHAGQAHWGLSLSKEIKRGERRLPAPKPHQIMTPVIGFSFPNSIQRLPAPRRRERKKGKASVFLSLSFCPPFLFFFFPPAHLFFKTVRSFQYFKSEENSLPAAVFEVVMVSKSHDWLTAVSPRGAH